MMLLSNTSRRSGFALVWALIGVMVIAFSLAALYVVGDSSARVARTELSQSRARYMAEAGIVQAEAAIARALAEQQTPPATLNLTLEEVQVNVSIQSGSAANLTTNDEGLHSYSQLFNIEAEVVSWGVRSRRRRVVRGRQTPIFQYAMFYENEMAFVHPAPMTIEGRVHCNSDIYIHSAWELNFNTNSLTSHGGLYGWVKDPTWLDWASGFADQQAPMIRQWVPDPFDSSYPFVYEPLPTQGDLSSAGATSISGMDSEFDGWDDDLDGTFVGADDWLPFEAYADAAYGPPSTYAGASTGTTLRTGTQGTQRQTVPAIEALDPFEPSTGTDADFVWDSTAQEYVSVASGTGTHARSHYNASAGLRLFLRADGTFKAEDENGIDVTAAASTAIDVVDFFDARQAEGSGNDIKMLRVDVAQLSSSGLYPANGLIYANAYGAGTGTQASGFALTNGADLPSALTVVSPNSVYLHGDYNTITKEPASVIADSLNLLSNFYSWNKTPGTLPMAAASTYNVSAVVGEGPQGSGMTGGPNNLARLHENWRDIPYTIEGSLACIAHSRYATGEFVVGSDYYEAADRTIRFDTDLTNPGGWPPFTPRSVSVEVLASQ